MHVLNPEDIDRELRKLAAGAYDSAAAAWIKEIPKTHILNLAGPEMAANFQLYDRAKIKPLPGEPPPFESLPDWAKAAIEHGERLHWFDPIQVSRREVWRTTENILNWLNGTVVPGANYAGLSFTAAAQMADRWYNEVVKPFKPENAPPKKRPGTMLNHKCSKCGHDFQYDQHRYRFAVSCPRCFELFH